MAGTIKELRQQNKAKRQLRRQNRKRHTSGLDLSGASTFAAPAFEATDFTPVGNLNLPQIDNFQMLDIAPAFRNRGEAFNAARKGGYRTFWYGGKEYTTDTKEEQDAKLGKNKQTKNTPIIEELITTEQEEPLTIYDEPDIWDIIGGKPQWLIDEDEKKAIRNQARNLVRRQQNLNGLKNFDWGAANARAAQGGRQNTNVVAYPNYGQSVNAADVTPNDIDLRYATLYRRQGGKFPVFRNGGIIGLI